MAKGLWGVIGKSLLGLLALLVLLFVTGIGFGYMDAQGLLSADDAMIWILTLFAILIMIGALWIGVAWMRSIDEAAREAHKAAWYWGGTAGMAVGGIGIVLSSLPQARALVFVGHDGRTDPAYFMAAGAMAMMLLMLAGYTVVWAWWWLARR